jgi:hypothetical protein
MPIFGPLVIINNTLTAVSASEMISAFLRKPTKSKRCLWGISSIMSDAHRLDPPAVSR